MKLLNTGHASPVGKPSSLGGIDPKAVLSSFNLARQNVPKLVVPSRSGASPKPNLAGQLLQDGVAL